MRASYNITNDLLRFWPDERLSEAEYKLARSLGFTFWHGSKCFAGKWRPWAEDFLLERGYVIEEDDTPDNVEARVERFSGYAEKAEQQAESSQAYLDERANTERRRKNAINSIERGLSGAEHWQQRIEASIRHAQFKDRPDVIARRIEGLEKDKRRHLASYTVETRVKPIEQSNGIHVWVKGGGRGGTWIEQSRLPAIQAEAERWIAHIDRRLLYERACLEAAGGIVAGSGHAPIDKGVFVQGGAIRERMSDDYLLIVRTNKKTVDVYNPHNQWWRYRMIDRSRIIEVLSPEQVKERFPSLSLPPEATAKKTIPKAEIEGREPKAMGAVGYYPGFCQSGELSWRLILKVNRTTLEILTKQNLTDGKVSFHIFKKPVAEFDKLKTPAEVKAEMPHLLTEFNELEAMKKRIAERQAQRAEVVA